MKAIQTRSAERGARNARFTPHSPFPVPHSDRSAFTLIEMMMVVGLIAILFAVGIPSFVRAQNQRPMKVATESLLELCSQARGEAIMSGRTVELRINAAEFEFSFAATGPVTETVVAMDPGAGRRPQSGSFKLPEQVGIQLVKVNNIIWEHGAAFDELVVRFFSNGTADELQMAIESLTREVRLFTVDPVTARADWELKNASR